MSEREFQTYLDELCRKLNLSEDQRRAIASEFRDHLEARMQELTGAGVEREDAILQALDEFGDAEGLARNLTRIQKNASRRTIMKWSLAVGYAAVFLLAATVWLTLDQRETPARDAAPPSAQAAGQLSERAPEPADPLRFALDRDIPVQQRSRPVTYREQSFHLLSAAKLRFSHALPEITDQDGPLLPKNVAAQDLMIDPGPAADPETHARPLYAVLTVGSLTFDDVTYRVSVALQDKQGGLLGTAHTQVHVPRIWLGVLTNMSQTYLLDFGPNLAWDRVERFDVSINEMPVLTPEDWQPAREANRPAHPAESLESVKSTEILMGQTTVSSKDAIKATAAELQAAIDTLGQILAERQSQLATKMDLPDTPSNLASRENLVADIARLEQTRKELTHLWFSYVIRC